MAIFGKLAAYIISSPLIIASRWGARQRGFHPTVETDGFAGSTTGHGGTFVQLERGPPARRELEPQQTGLDGDSCHFDAPIDAWPNAEVVPGAVQHACNTPSEKT